jgi:acyl-CoA thioesterase
LFRENPYTDMHELVKNDRIAHLLGITLEGCGRGWAKTSMVVKEDALNAYDATHGAALYALSDVAFAVACNSHGQKAVALNVTIHYRRPVGVGVRLYAEAREESRGRTTGLYRIRVTDEEGRLVAVADGLAYISG